MEIQLKRLRKERGYKSRDAFAAALGDPFNSRQIKSWESGERKLSLEQACVLADFLRCSLDELAGRHFVPAASPADEAHRQIVAAFDDLSEEGREVAVNVVSGMARTYPQAGGPPRLVAQDASA